ncbi:RHS repeat-associated core domain-containing protein [Puteibacter caeruleilacunae]|nr:RHS repeat-associated core domain-containing protein [Puteibacter caeruleilacunae]
MKSTYKKYTKDSQYKYDASGVKWQKTTNATRASSIQYYGSFIYQGGSLDRVLPSDGFYDVPTSTYHYYLKDHLGNTRMSFHYSGSTPVVNQKTEYYPFGSMFTENNLAENKYLYNGKELNNEFFENYDYGARFYDAELGRFHTQDRFAEKYLDFTPYQYAANNPVLMIDINGDSLWINTGSRKLLYDNGKLYTKKGKDVTHKAYNKKGEAKKNFLGNVVSGLSDLNTTDEGRGIISDLQKSSNHFTIASGWNHFDPWEQKSNQWSHLYRNNAEGVRVQSTGVDVISGYPTGEMGSGGIIYWDPSERGSIISNSGSVSMNPIISLIHEMKHALDANYGLLDTRNVSFNGGYEERSEIRVVYSANMVCLQLKISGNRVASCLRTNYKSGGAYLLDKSGQPLNIGPPK